MNRIKEILKKQGRSQVYLSRELGKSKNMVSLWCRNKIQPTVPDLYRIAKLLGVKVSYLLLEEHEIALLKRKTK